MRYWRVRSFSLVALGILAVPAVGTGAYAVPLTGRQAQTEASRITTLIRDFLSDDSDRSKSAANQLYLVGVTALPYIFEEIDRRNNALDSYPVLFILGDFAKPAYIKQLHRGSLAVRAAIVEAAWQKVEDEYITLRRFGPKSPQYNDLRLGQTLWTQADLIEAIALQLSSSDPGIKERAVRVLFLRDERRYKSRIARLIHDEGSEVRMATFWAIAHWAEDGRDADLLQNYLKSREKLVVSIDGNEEYERLLRGLRASEKAITHNILYAETFCANPYARTYACYHFSFCKDKRVMARVKELLTDKSPFVRGAALHALGRAGGEASFKLIEVYARSSQWMMRMDAAISYGVSRSEKAVGPLLILARDKDGRVRVVATRQLARLKYKTPSIKSRVMSFLSSQLKDPDPNVSTQARMDIEEITHPGMYNNRPPDIP